MATIGAIGAIIDFGIIRVHDLNRITATGATGILCYAKYGVKGTYAPNGPYAFNGPYADKASNDSNGPSGFYGSNGSCGASPMMLMAPVVLWLLWP